MNRRSAYIFLTMADRWLIVSCSATDRLEAELMSELENGRLVRLLCKLGFINERPEFARDPRWSETGDRYIIKLFRDYVFHQVDEHGNPVVNMSHVLTCLNKVRFRLRADSKTMWLNKVYIAGRRQRRTDHAGVSGRTELSGCEL